MNAVATTRPAGDAAASMLFHRRYLELADQIERRFPVAQWRCRDLQIWPLARMDLYLDLYRSHVGIASVPARPLWLRALGRYAMPWVNLWRSRRDLAHWVARPKPARAILLGDGVSLDCIDGCWRDRYGEPLMAALQSRGENTFLMQTGDLSRLPWYRPTYSASNVVARAARRRSAIRVTLDLPEFERVRQYIWQHDIAAPSVERHALERRAQLVLATACEFERILRVVRPTLAFVVTYYADLAPAFLLACRRQHVLSVDLQHCPQEGAHKAYGWSAVPQTGYAVLPAVFWSWTESDARYIQQWAARLEQPWHRSLYGGHQQLRPFLNDDDPISAASDAKFARIGSGARFEREILVTLQPISGYRAQWDALAAQIEASPREWRWWIRRHPASRPYQDAEYPRLVNLRLPNVKVAEASSLPLPALLRHASVLVSRFSGASAEAANFGVPALFLSEEARGQFSSLIEHGSATIVAIPELIQTIAELPRRPRRPALSAAPCLADTLSQLDEIAHEYARLCRTAAAGTASAD
jgi:hypothetical protein